ncbi:MAG: hypothetical protein ABI172_02250 [Ginsengibacter sp.]|jgi:thiol-disulfide isomerase/thioredoxin
MMQKILAEGFGYLATLLLGISLVVNNDLKFRWINASGCFSFVVYGILIHAFPIIITNALLFFINLYYLIKIYRTTENFDIIEFKGEETIVDKFLSFYDSDIKTYFPEYVHNQKENNINYIILRNLMIANIFVAELDKEGLAEVKLNYTIPKFRDYKVGRFIFNKNNDLLISRGVKKLIYKTVFNKGHVKFLKVMNFRKDADNKGYSKDLYLTEKLLFLKQENP